MRFHLELKNAEAKIELNLDLFPRPPTNSIVLHWNPNIQCLWFQTFMPTLATPMAGSNSPLFCRSMVYKIFFLGVYRFAVKNLQSHDSFFVNERLIESLLKHIFHENFTKRTFGRNRKKIIMWNLLCAVMKKKSFH